jgi:hypothetical protein
MLHKFFQYAENPSFLSLPLHMFSCSLNTPFSSNFSNLRDTLRQTR